MQVKKLKKKKKNHIGMNNINKLNESMHTKKKGLSYTVYNYIDRALGIPLASVHPGFLLPSCSKVVFSMLTMQTLMRAKLQLSFFLCSLYALKITTKEFN